MRVGFITQLLWSRYGEFWVRLSSGAGLTPVYAASDEVRRSSDDPRLESIPGTAFRLAAAQALALEADVIFAPDLNPGESATRGGGQDAFIANFPEALAATLSGLPPVVGVPASLSVGGLETLVVSTLLNLTRDPGLVRRVWERNRGAAKAPRLPEPRWRVRPSEVGTVGVVGQPWLLSGGLARRVSGESHLVSQHQLEPSLLREEGRRIDDRLVGTDTEVLGAARFLGRKGSIERLIMIADETSGTDAFLVSQVKKIVYKPFSVVYVQRLGENLKTVWNAVVPFVAFLAAASYAVVNAFGAWLVSRRKPWVAGLFMVSAVILVVAAAAFVSDIPYTRMILAAGLIAASVSSYINAEVVIGRVVWRNHLIRALAAGLIYALGELAVR